MYLLCGTFNTIALYILAFDSVARSLTVVSRIDGFGPHQYIGINEARDRVYTTTWAEPARLSSWAVERANASAPPTVAHLNNVDITATSSYIAVHKDNTVYSAGGPSGEVHTLDPHSRAFGHLLQRLLYVAEDALPTEDKTRVALRYGAHGIDVSSADHVFVPHLGRNSIFMYSVRGDRTLEFITETPAPRENQGPRHNVPSHDGRFLYTVTEHTSEVHVYSVLNNGLQWLQTISVIPQNESPHKYRGDTLRLSNNGDYLFATTRGSSPITRGWLSVYSRDPVSGKLGTRPLDRYRTATSGGKANAIEVLPFKQDSSSIYDVDYARRIEKLVLTDDEQGMVFVLEWDGVAMREAARVILPDGSMASHAVWL